ncbi:MAG: hypothetical protein D6691_07170 [Candidatus Hydrogenedentota bacterium]|nr:MAG: hypothetical protein D6691_07170 [Candidatus Hydrogenedentota bacterium]
MRKFDAERSKRAARKVAKGKRVMATRVVSRSLTHAKSRQPRSPSLDEGHLTAGLLLFVVVCVLGIARVWLPFYTRDLRVEAKRFQERARALTVREQILQNEKAMLSDMPKLLQQARTQLGMVEVSSRMRGVVAIPAELQMKYAAPMGSSRVVANVEEPTEFVGMAQRLVNLFAPTKAFAAEGRAEKASSARPALDLSPTKEGLSKAD